ncbi:MAG: hypothetical protein DLM55_00825 [Acidimicrobiales bacterium]|nr:MAG: hypothetical protein DLM55_00825 [Acidimicrobiales bacterium]
MPRRPWLKAQTLPFLPQPVHAGYDFGGLPAIPVVRVEEAIAEKLARYARVGLARDLFDLAWYGRTGAIDQQLIRYLWILKVYNDVVIDGRWSNRIFDPNAILAPRSVRDIDDEQIGYLTQPINIAAWEVEFRSRYAFLRDLNDDERQWATCHAGRRYEFIQLISKLDQSD